MTEVGPHEAKTELPQRADSLAAVHGALRGKVQVMADFDELPVDIADAFGASDDAGPTTR